MDNNTLRAISLRLSEINSGIVKAQPFFGRLLLRLPIRFGKCGTACTDMQSIIFDPDFAQRLDDDGLHFVMMHELMHCVLKHCTRGRGLLHTLYNVACDIVVNSLVLEAMGLRSIKIDGEEVMHLAPDGREGRVYTAEEVYGMLLESAESGQGMAGLSGGENGGAPSKSGHGEPSEPSKDGSEGNGEDGKDSVKTVDSHQIWENVSGDGMLENRWDANVASAVNASGYSSNLPGGIARIVNKIYSKPKVDWRAVLHEFIKPDRHDYVFNPPDRRFYDSEFIFPTFAENAVGSAVERLWFVVDTSASVTLEALSLAMAEITNAIDQVGTLSGYVSFFDTEVSEPVPFESGSEIEKIKPVGGGGTSFHKIFASMEGFFKDEPPAYIIIMTDGYAPYPPEDVRGDIPVLWLITDSDMTPPWGISVKIRTDS